MEIVGCPVFKYSLSALLLGSNGKDKPIWLVVVWLQELPEGVTLFNQPSMGLKFGFSVGVFSLNLLMKRTACAIAGGFGIKSHLLLPPYYVQYSSIGDYAG